jgi:hypothetical protein
MAGLFQRIREIFRGEKKSKSAPEVAPKKDAETNVKVPERAKSASEAVPKKEVKSAAPETTSKPSQKSASKPTKPTSNKATPNEKKVAPRSTQNLAPKSAALQPEVKPPKVTYSFPSIDKISAPVAAAQPVTPPYGSQNAQGGPPQNPLAEMATASPNSVGFSTGSNNPSVGMGGMNKF